MPKRDERGERREILLEAALRIISREGLRGLKYRSLAKEAQVPLGSATYYFSSIEDVYVGAYALFNQKTHGNTEGLKQAADRILIGYLKNERSPEALASAIEALSVLLCDYVEQLVVRELDHRKIEAAFTHAAIVDGVIREPFWNRQQLFLQLSSQWFEDFGLQRSQEAAACFLALINHLERQHLLSGRVEFEREPTLVQLRFFFDTLFKGAC